ncbi:MAG: ergothioneine biosynthesis protein EgtB [Acidobacteria bacterium]|nr:ergothioneine biosynthesis protein EgtB [Acidobacteriota bacterium]
MDPNTQSALTVDRAAAMEWYLRNRDRSRRIFDLIDPTAYYARPIALRNPIVFYEGHLPAFSLMAFLHRGLDRPGVDPRLEALFARGIDPDSIDAAVPRSGAGTIWPPREEVLAFGSAADARILDALAGAPFDEDRPPMRRAEALYTALEHEAMHQETLLYMWHRLPYEQKLKPEGVRYQLGDEPPEGAAVRIPAGTATLGADPASVRFGWDNEFHAHTVDVPDFEIDRHNVTNADFLKFVEAGAYRTRTLWSDADWAWLQSDRVEHPAFWVPDGERGWSWRGMFELIPLPGAWPVYVSQAEASAYARWTRRRLPTEAEWHRAATGARPGNIDFQSWEPVPAGARPGTESDWGVHDLVGNGWEWTSTIFGPFAGFEPMVSYPEYSADFFDGEHYVLKGASPATAAELVRASFRNWFRPNYPYVYATFRTVAA